MVFNKKSFWVFALILAHVACAPEKSGLESSQDVAAVRALTKSEREKDFEIMVEAFRSLYAPLNYKEKRFGFKFEDLVAEYSEKAKAAQSDEEFFGVLKEFTARFKDGHVGLTTPVGDASTVYSVPLFIMPVQSRAIVAQIDDQSITATHGIEVGDEILEIDGVKTFDLLPIITKYNTLGNDISDQHYIFRALARPAYMTELKPTRSTVRLKVAKPNGEVLERELVWNITNTEDTLVRPRIIGHPLSYAASANGLEILARANANVTKLSSDEPYWLNPKTEKLTRMRRVTPTEETFKKFLKEAKLPEDSTMPKLFAVIYRFNGLEFGKGKTFLLIRMGTYSTSNFKEYPVRVAWYKSILEDYKDLVDALVIDQTHNGGGYLNYGLEFASLFADGQSRGAVSFLNADRRWLMSFKGTSQYFSFLKIGENKNIADLGFKLVEDALDKGLRLTERPVPIGSGQYHIPQSNFQFDKPVLMLIDELSGSCADFVPMLLKENGKAVLFGERTAGWGGNVESVVTLPNASVELTVTRGLGTIYNPDGQYDFEKGMLENNGVEPHVRYQHTVDDVRAGYINYIRAFSLIAASLEAK